jgi:uncharacterized YccA/Bax inhibitor family protein
MTLRTGNPAFSPSVLSHFEDSFGSVRSTTMTVTGTVAKSFILLAILMATAIWTWTQIDQHTLNQGLLAVSTIGGLVVALITCFRPTAAPFTAPIYAAFEGVALGALSNFLNMRFPGIAQNAVALTLGTLFTMLVIYTTRLVRVTDRLAMGIFACTGAVALVYLLDMVLRLFGVPIPFIHESNGIGIAFSLFVVGLAAFNLLLDFDFIERASYQGMPKSMEWYGAFGLMVTLVWLYLEILRFLAKLQSRND